MASDDDTTTDDLGRVAERFRDIGDHLRKMTHRDPLEAVARMAVELIDRAEWASITRLADGEFTTVALTDDMACEADAIQYSVGSGPCLDAIIDDAVYRPSDLSHCEKWPEFGRRVSRELGVESMLSYRLLKETDDESIHGLNIYSRGRAAFDDDDVLVGLMIATHGALAAQSVVDARKIDNLQQALVSNREIGTAMGVLMTRHHVTRDQAFDLLRMASQNSNRKLRDVALDVAETGELPLPAVRRGERREA
ncbi:ANTAR domain-containing protein [Humibacillus xanthopallidus]|uniref:ANTAR domain-containing protein n=1 Tax=Humibacillus xanthopallidus TaxID=412689 RepID=A0A543PQ83_9MICO|nr:ANTAR domain-containing protein [Humibacillus xanthopallidus]TQN46234.1 ANTAR domain-containing protein [Humibacillus xanthopallidus]